MLISFSEFFKVGMLQKLWSRPTIISIVYQHLHYHILCILWHMRYQLGNSHEFLWLKVKLHVRSMPKASLQIFTSKNCQWALGVEFPLCCGFYWSDQARSTQETRETAIGPQRTHSQLPIYPSCTRSNRQSTGTQALYTTSLKCTRWTEACCRALCSCRGLLASQCLPWWGCSP